MGAYGETLRIGWEATEPLLAELIGRTVVTSDHGNMYGERPWPYVIPIYDHPTKIRPEELVKVPWGVIEGEGEQSDIVNDGMKGKSEADTIDDKVLQDQLEVLRYA